MVVPPPGPLDGDQLASARDAALSRAQALGCSTAELRVEHLCSQQVRLRDARLEGAAEDVELGMGLRVVMDGALGFAASVATHPDQAAALVDEAVGVARTIARAGGRTVELADEPGHGAVTWQSDYGVDPVDVPLADKVGLLAEWSGRLLVTESVDHVTADLLAVTEDKYYADLAGTQATQRRVRVHPTVEAIAVDPDGGFETMRTVAPPVGRGWEYLEGDGVGLGRRAGRASPSSWRRRSGPPPSWPGTTTWSSTRPTCGSPSTSRSDTPPSSTGPSGTRRPTPAPPSPPSTSWGRSGTAPRSCTSPGTGPSPTGWPRWPSTTKGCRASPSIWCDRGVLVGYQLDRSIAAAVDWGRSNGCAFADSPLHVPIQRMANVSLQPAEGDGPTTEELIAGVERGLYIVGDKSWSIDMQRYNFQFTGQRFFRIEGGKLAGQVRDVAYQATTTEFWGAMEAVGGRSTYLLGGAFNCGKGQPGQVAPVSHGCPSVLVRGVRVLNAREESGR